MDNIVFIVFRYFKHYSCIYTVFLNEFSILKYDNFNNIFHFMALDLLGFNIKKRIKVLRSNAMCLPQPTLLPYYYLYKIYGTYFGIWLLIFTQAYIQRLRRVICAYYYRKREKKRVLFLYNETLKRRIGFFR